MFTLLPGVIFPPISYCVLLYQKECKIDGWGYYHKQSIRNHFKILSANGVLSLTLPIQSTQGALIPLNQIKIENGVWNRPMITALQSAYGKSPFFFFFKDELVHLLQQLPGRPLFEAQQLILNWILPYLGMDKIDTTPGWEIMPESIEQDFRKIKKKWEIESPIQHYHQVFMDRFPFESDLSILDLLFNLGPQAKAYIAQHPEIKIKLDLGDRQNSSAK